MFFWFILLALSGWHKQLDSLLETTTQKRFNGVVLIAHQDSILAYKQVQRLPNAQGMRPQSQFVIASLSKQITAALVLKACEEGKLQLDTPLSDFFPHKKQPFRQTITIHHLLSHTSGLNSTFKKGLRDPVGSKFRYENFNYILLGQILEKVYRKPYNKLVNAFFQQIGMERSFALLHIKTKKNQQKNPDLVWGYLDNKGQLIGRQKLNPVSFNPTGGLVSTAQDLLIWNRFLHESEGLSAESKQKMFTGYMERPGRLGNLRYGYGIHVSDSGNLQERYHAGFIKGYISSLFYYPQHQISLIILENYSGQDQAGTTYIVHDVVREWLRKQLIAPAIDSATGAAAGTEPIISRFSK